MTLVVIPAGDIATWRLPAAEELEMSWIPGGHRSLYEMAVAAAARDHDVEIRGSYHASVHEIARFGGGRPRFPTDPRPPRSDDVILVAEAGVSPVLFGRILLSPARAILALLAPPGLFGPPILPGFRQVDPLTVDPGEVGRPEHFVALRELGFELLTNSPETARRAAAAGEECTFITTGQPVPIPEPEGGRPYDVAFLAANRWAPLSRRVAEQVEGSVLEIPEGGWHDVLAALGSARILILPVRVEGRSSLQIEARAVGTVPVALSSNAFYDGLEEGGGVLVGSLDEMPPAIARLLSRPDELAERSRRAVVSARRQMSWDPFVDRFHQYLSAAPPPGVSGRMPMSIGEALTEPLDSYLALPETLERLQRGVAWQRRVISGLEAAREELEGEVDALRRLLSEARGERDAALRVEERLRTRRSVRLAMRVADAFARLTGRPRARS